MANITEEHLHHMARRHHATMKKLDTIQEKFAAHAGWLIGTVEVGAGAWIGGVVEGKTAGGTFLNVPWNLGAGAALLAVAHLGGHLPAVAKFSDHLNNLGNGFLSSFTAAQGYAFGKRWKESGKMLGGGGHPWTQPYAEVPPAVHGDLSEAQMAAIVQRMQAAAAAAHG